MLKAKLKNIAEAKEEGPATKRQRREYVAAHDLNIKIEDENIGVVSHFLTFVSPVFRRMLHCGMAEAQTKEISLPGKKKEEFHVFMDAIEPLSTLQLTQGNAHFLARWADEYDVEGLKERCDKKLLLRPVTVTNLVHALECNLQRCTEKCYAAVVKNIHPHMSDLVALGSSFPPEMLSR
eukprot:5181549-Amphidinium_carterae.1